MSAFDEAANWLHGNKGFAAADLQAAPVKKLTESTFNVLKNAVNTGVSQQMPPAIRAALEKNVFVFSSMKTYTQLKEANDLLLNPDGNIKPRQQWLQDVKPLSAKYNEQYLEAEHIFATRSAQMADKWQQYEQDGDRYHLQYRTAQDDKVRKAHAALANITLPVDDPFWNSYFPPNGWRCRCTVVQVRKGKYEVTDSDTANKLGDVATTQIGKDGKNKAEIFRFNAGKEKKVFPPGHPYTYSGNCNTQLANENNDKCKAIKAVNEQADERFGKKYSVAEKQAVYAKPVEDQYTTLHSDNDSGGKVLAHQLLNPEKSDFKNVLAVAKEFAKKGGNVLMPPEIHFSEKEARAKLLPGIKGNSNPDIKIGEQYFDVKTPTVKSKAVKRMIEAAEQETIPVITDLQQSFTAKDVDYLSNRAFNDINFLGNQINWLVKGNLLVKIKQAKK